MLGKFMEEIIRILNKNYPMRVNRLELVRDMGSSAYMVFACNQKYFLRVLKPAFLDTALNAVNIQVFLQKYDFPVPPIILSKENTPYVQDDKDTYILYEYIEGHESNPEQDAEEIGGLVGRLHHIMKEYSGELVKHDKQFFIGRCTDILRKKQYPRVDEFTAYGEVLWECIKDLPRGFCHGDMYSGNIYKTLDGRLFVLDFDTSCEGFPMYDPTMICNMTKFSVFDERNHDRSNKVLSRFLSEYLRCNSISQLEIDSFYYLIAMQHFAIQAARMEIFGFDCIDNAYLDNQLDWLYRWREQCKWNFFI